MTATQFFNRVEQLVKNLTSFGKKVRSAYKGLDLSPVSEATSKLFPIITKKKWPNLLSVCRSELKEVQMQQKTLRRIQTTYNGFFEKLDSLKDDFEQHYQPPKNQPDWSAARKKITDDLEAGGVAAADIKHYVDKLGNTGGLSAYSLYSKQISDTSELLQYAVQR